MNWWYGARQGEVSRHEILCWCAAILMLVSFTALGMLLMGIEGTLGVGGHAASIALAFAGAAILPNVFWPTIIVIVPAALSLALFPHEEREMNYQEANYCYQRFAAFRYFGWILLAVVGAIMFANVMSWCEPTPVAGVIFLFSLILLAFGRREKRLIPVRHWEHIKRVKGRELAYQLTERERS